MDADKICRLCGYNLYKPKNIYATPGLFGKISRYTDLKIRYGDGLPSSICEMCDIKLQMSDNFRLEVNKVYEKTKEYLVQRVPESYESRSSAFAHVKRENSNDVTEWRKSDHHLSVTSQKNDHRFRIRHERMRLSQRRPQHSRISAPLVARKSKRSLINSFEEARSLVASYKALMNRCDPGSYLEEFAVSSSVPISDNESDPGDENVRLTAARCRTLEENCSMADEQASRERTETPANPDLSFQSDPLNLLKIKSIRPLRDDERGSKSPGDNHDFHSSTSPGYDDRVATMQMRDLEEIQNPDYRSSDMSDVDSSDEEEARTVSTTSSQASVKIIEKPATFAVPSSGSIRQNNVAANTVKRDVLAQSMSDSKCPVCARVCVSAFGLGVHMRTHMSSKCQVCDAPTATKDKYKEHMQSHMTLMITTPLAKCNVCKKTFKSKMGLSVHMRVHTRTTVPVQKECPQCKKIFASYRGYKIHVAKSHSGYGTE